MKLFEKEDSHRLYNLIQENKTHLTQNGDYMDMVKLSITELARQLETEDEKERTFLLVLERKYIGTVSLIKYEKTVYGLGYWIAGCHSGKGYMTSAVRAIIDFAANAHGATEIWAGIKASNSSSINLVRRLGFTLAREQSTHQSYKIRMSAHGTRT